ncbi:hypothetical protein HN018_23680 (plasmid) [Lichenicola cladoniae]|uniref:Uncharacterized protein n=1 Tax=Lichenicola cladoniae TaxID=1484109 RepID=A0A6M8HXW4_9PROT|nr:hypothetical protein [Lichenicola cladoniae]NPD66278.1 hypothetical protein [Acetobacteraceae bacterium]QKE93188.1 hypothetical protein HN018_23680 [Lichenicola cladoniae]
MATQQIMHDGSVIATWGVQVAATSQWIGKVHPIGEGTAHCAEAHANAGLFAASKLMADVLDEATKAWIEQFNGPDDQDLSVSGADLVDWFAQWRLRARKALDAAGVP